MRNKTTLLILTLLFLVACPAFAQGTGVNIQNGESKFLGGMLGLGLAGGLCGIGQGKAAAGAAEAIARNPGAGGRIQLALILGLVFIETLTIYALAIVLRG